MLEKIAEDQARELIRVKAENSHHREVQGHSEDAKKEFGLEDMKRYLKGAMRHLMVRQERPALSKTGSGSARKKSSSSALDTEEPVDSSDL